MGENDFVEITEDKAIISIVFEDGSIGLSITMRMEEIFSKRTYRGFL